MNRTVKITSILIIPLLLATLFSSPAQSAPNACNNPSFTSDTVITLAESPYHICDSNGPGVQAGVTLTIQPGVTMIFDGSSYGFNISGTLNAVGTAAQPITITGASASAGSWRVLNVNGSVSINAVLNLDYTTVSYGGASNSAEIIADRANITIDHSHIQNSSSDGMDITNNATFTISNSSFANNTLNALLVSEPKVDMSLTGLTATGNGTNAVRIGGINTNMAGQRRWNNPGIPYIIGTTIAGNDIHNAPGDVLTLDPGIEMDFESGSTMTIGGTLIAQGTPTESILMTGVAKSAGAWRGLSVSGGTSLATAQLDYVTIEYGGQFGGSDIAVTSGKLIVHHSILRNSLNDGVQFNSFASGSVLDSQVYGNGQYGMRTTPTGSGVLASDNWWGAASGPHPDSVACGTGTGDKVTAGVLFQPFANAQNAISAIPLSAYPSMTLSPRRWYAPADGVTRIYFDITLRDGNGTPITGRTVKLTSNLGTVVDGGSTDANGKALAYLTSNATGNAAVTATLQAQTACEGAVSPESDVTFTTPVAVTDLLPDSEAPYFNNDMSVTPQPVIVGVTETILARLTNPSTSPITADIEFDYVQSSVGLAFGPIKTIPGVVIPAGASIPLSATFVPPVSGHFCVQVAYTITKIGAASVLMPQAGRQLKQFNVNSQQPSTGGGGKQADLSKTRNSLKAVNQFVNRTYDNSLVVPLAVANAGIEWDLNNAEKISNALNGDPPRQDYTLITQPVVLQLAPVQPGPGLSAARAAAMNDLDTALAQANAYGTAAGIAFDRVGGATAAGDLNWESTQEGVMLEYNYDFGQGLITASQKITTLLAVAASEGTTSLVISASDVATMQAQLAGGFSSQAIADAHALGFSDPEIEAIRQNIINARPEDLAGDIIANMSDLSTQLATLGQALMNPSVFNPGITVGGGAPVNLNATGNSMAQVYDTVTTIPVGNPTGAAGDVTLSVKRINIPADWIVQVSPAVIPGLQPGQSVNVTVTLIAGSPVPQGTLVRVALEGSIGSQLLGGVVIDTPIPYYRPFDGKLRVYLPAITH